MTRSQLMRAVRARGVAVAAHQVEYLVQAGKLTPAPELDGGLRRVYQEAHVDQVAAAARRTADRRHQVAG